jgi:hypothetical protein
MKKYWTHRLRNNARLSGYERFNTPEILRLLDYFESKILIGIIDSVTLFTAQCGPKTQLLVDKVSPAIWDQILKAELFRLVPGVTYKEVPLEGAFIAVEVTIPSEETNEDRNKR